jgi:hypothetical protein
VEGYIPSQEQVRIAPLTRLFTKTMLNYQLYI